MYSQVPSDIIQESLSATSMIKSLNDFFNGLARYCNVFVLLLLTIIAIPFIGLVMLYVRIKLERALKEEILIRFENYPQIRKEYEFLSSLHSKMFAGSEFNINHANKFLTVIFQIRAIERILVKRIEKIRNSLSEFDPKPVEFGIDLTPVSEDELWRSRAKAYEYLG